MQSHRLVELRSTNAVDKRRRGRRRKRRRPRPRSAICVCACERGRGDQMQYTYPHVDEMTAHLLIIVVSLPALVTHWLPSMELVGSYKRFNG